MSEHITDKEPSHNTQYIKQRTELYKILEPGFGKRIASDTALNVVNTIDKARAVLEKPLVDVNDEKTNC